MNKIWLQFISLGIGRGLSGRNLIPQRVTVADVINSYNDDVFL